MRKKINTGKVVLVGAGPGDPELLTIKALRYLQRADVVLTDRLVSETIISDYVNANTKVIYVGKQFRRAASMPQKTINELMIGYALQGKLVVRLKGGDVSIFSNIHDELETLAAEGIPYEIVPGVTAALGAAAYSGIPLTARGYSTAVRFLTCYKSDVITEEYWKELAQTNDTLVFYMSSETLNGVVKKLTTYGMNPDKLIAVIEQATTPFQYVQTASLYNYEKEFGNRRLASPSLVIIGKVVALHQQFGWLKNNLVKEEYFKTIADRLIPYTNKKRA
ncbi:MAG: uroporphyrinogen-III C-methyltransferase [Bacteroidota bacterium]|nr:uroporphyrinogen-III C-methyltransferase [Bacteroidota bacterium]